MEEDKGRDFFKIILNNDQFRKALKQSIDQLEEIGKVAEINGKKIDEAFGGIKVQTDASAFEKISKELERMNQLEERRFDLAGRLREERKQELADRAKIREEKQKEREIEKAQAKEARELARQRREEQKSINAYLRELERAKKSMSASPAERAISGLERDIAGVFAIDKLKNFAMEIVNVRGEIERLEKSFSVLIGSEARSQALMNELKTFAIETPFGLEEIASASKQLLAYGFQAEEINGIMRQLGEVSAGLGVSLKDMAYLYGTTMTQGRLYARDLLQFTTRGIPLLDELTKQFGVSASEIYKMVSAGKIGFPEVQKAIASMTGEGGRFNGMMEKITGTVYGQIERLKDAYQLMLNDIGKSQEGLIKGTIGALSTLVANYEKVGKVLMALVAVYGTYKAALIATATLESVVVKWKALHKTAVLALTIANSTLTASTVSLTMAQVALKRAMLTSIPMLATAAVVGLGYGIYKLATYETEAEKATKRLGEAFKNTEGVIEAEKMKVGILFAELKQAKEGTEAYEKAKSKIIGQYGKYLNGLDEETRSLKNVAGAYDAITQSITNMYREREKQAFLDKELSTIGEKRVTSYEKIKELLEDEFKGQKIDIGITEKGEPIQALASEYYLNLIKRDLEETGKISDEVKSIIGKFSSENFTMIGDFIDKAILGNKVYTNIKGRVYTYTNELQQEIDNLLSYNKIVEELPKRLETTYGSSVEKVLGIDEKKVEKSINNIKKQIEELINGEGGIKALEERIKSIRNGGDLGEYASANEAIKDLEKQLKGKYDEYKLLTGEEYGGKGKLKQVSDGGKAELALRKGIEEDKIRLEEDAYRKRKAQIDLNYQREIEKIKSYEEELKKARGVKNESGEVVLNAEDQTLVDKAYRSNEEVRQREIVDLNRSTLNELLKDILTYEQRRENIEKEYAERRKRLYREGDESKGFREGVTEGNLEELKRSEEEAVAEIDLTFAQREETFKAWMQSIAQLGIIELKKRLEEAKKELENAEKNGIGGNELAQKRAKVNELTKNVKEAEAGINKGAEGGKEKWSDLQKVLTDCNSVFGEIGDAVGGVAGEAIKAAGAMGTSVVSIISGIDKISNVSAKGIAGAAEKATAALAIIQAAMQIVTFIVGLFNDDESRKKQNERLQREIDNLQWELDHQEIVRLNRERNRKSIDDVAESYEKYANTLRKVYAETTRYVEVVSETGKRKYYIPVIDTKAMDAAKVDAMAKAVEELSKAYASVDYSADKAFGSEKYDSAKENIKNLTEQQMKVYEQLKNEQANKKVDEDKVEELKKKIEELGYEAVSIINEMVEDIMGDTSENIAQKLGDALVSAFESGEDAAKAWGKSVNEIVKDILKRMAVQEFLEKPLGEIFNKYRKYWYANDGAFAGIDAVIESLPSLKDEINKLYSSDYVKQIQELFKANSDFFDIEEATRTATQKGIATASQDTVDELNGRMTAVQGHTYSIAENTKLLVQNTSMILSSVIAIEHNTDRLEKMENDVGVVKDTLNTIALKGVKMI